MELKTEKIKKIERIKHKGYLYNLTTETGNLFANKILVSNSGGLGTPAYERLIPGMIHRANGGVLFIDEVSLLDQHSQQELLSALQEKKYPITGQSERSSGAMVRSEAVPCIPKDEIVTINNKEISIKRAIDKLNKPQIINLKNVKIIIPREDFWINAGNEKSKIILFYEREYTGKLIEIEFKNKKKIRLTPDHPLLLKNNQFILAKHLKKGDDIKTK